MNEWCITQSNKKALFFGPYECIGSSQATSAEGLAFNAKFMQGFLSSIPSGYVVATALRSILIGLAQRKPGLQSGIADLQLWAGSRADVIMTILGHLRRLKREKEKLTVKSKLDPTEYLEIHKCLMIITNSNGPPEDSGSDAPTCFYDVDQEAANSQELADSQEAAYSQEAASSQEAADSQEDIMDADGWPACLNDDGDHDDDDDEHDHEVPHLSEEEDATKTPVKKVRSQPASARKSAKHGLEPSSPEDKLHIQGKVLKSANVTVTKNNKATKEGKPKSVESKSFGLIKLGCYSSQSYIQMKVESGWKLIVAVSTKQSADHDMIAKMLFLKALGPGLTKADMIAARAELLTQVA
jgi:hypothetical protein